MKELQPHHLRLALRGTFSRLCVRLDLFIGEAPLTPQGHVLVPLALVLENALTGLEI